MTSVKQMSLSVPHDITLWVVIKGNDFCKMPNVSL